MSTPPVSDAVRRFVARHLDSVEMLEVLLLLFRRSDTWWSAETVGGELGTTSESAERCLETLASRRFLDVRLESAVLFRYRPMTRELDDGVGLLAEAYALWRFQVIGLLASDRLKGARTFAEAFRLRKEKGGDDGNR